MQHPIFFVELFILFHQVIKDLWKNIRVSVQVTNPINKLQKYLRKLFQMDSNSVPKVFYRESWLFLQSYACTRYKTIYIYHCYANQWFYFSYPYDDILKFLLDKTECVSIDLFMFELHTTAKFSLPIVLDWDSVWYSQGLFNEEKVMIQKFRNLLFSSCRANRISSKICQ